MEVRVPYDAMLSRYSKIDLRTNEYIKPVNPNVVYGSLTYVSLDIIIFAKLKLMESGSCANHNACPSGSRSSGHRCS
jgi:acyl-CoA oxidase